MGRATTSRSLALFFSLVLLGIFGNSVAQNSTEECISEAGFPFFPDRSVRGKWDDEIDLLSANVACDHAVADNIESGYLWFLWGRVRMLDGRIDAALSSFDRSIELDFGGGHVGRLWILGDNLDASERSAKLQRAVDLGFWPAEVIQAEDKYSRGQAESAIEQLQELSSSQYPPAQFTTALILLQQDAKANQQQIRVLLEAAAESGHLLAIVSLGDLYSGAGMFRDFEETPRDAARATKMYEQAAARGHVASKYMIAMRLLFADETPKDEDRALRLLHESASEKHAPAQESLAYLYIDGHLVEEDFGKGVRLLQEAADNGNANAAYVVGKALINNEAPDFLPKNVGRGITYLKAAVEAGHLEAAGMLGAAYLQGTFVPLNFEKGRALILQSAEQGFGTAQLVLGEALLFGTHGFEVDEEGAWHWLNRAIEQDLPSAHLYVGLMHENSSFVSQDIMKAFSHYLRAAQGGVTAAYYMVGDGYVRGLGIDKNEKEGLIWLKRAADAGELQAMSLLGQLYFDGGDTFESNLDRSIKFVRAAAEGGHPWSQFELGYSYLQGIGVEQSDKEAIKWLTRSADADIPMAMYYLGKTLVESADDSVRSEMAGHLWLERALENEPTKSLAATVLAEAYEYGVGVRKDPTRAIELYLAAGSPLGAAYLLFYGEDDVRDFKRGEEILRRCIDETQNAGCATFIGRAYNDLTSDHYDNVIARKWFESGAAGGDVGAYLLLSELYRFGNGVLADIDKAEELVRQAELLNEEEGAIRVDSHDILLAYARVYLYRGDSTRAEEYFRRGLLASEDSDDAELVGLTLVAMSELGNVYMNQGRYGAALALGEDLRQRKFDDKATQGYAKFFGAIIVSGAYMAMGDIARANAILENDPAIRAFLDEFEGSHTDAFRVMLLGSISFALERFSEAEQLLQSALPELQSQFGRDSYFAVLTGAHLGITKFRIGKSKEAERILLAALSRARKAGFDDRLDYFTAQAELAKIYAVTNRSKKAKELIEAVIGRLVAKLSSPNSSESIGLVTERRRAKEIIATYLDLTGIEESGKDNDRLNSSFEYAQLSTSLVVNEAIRAWAKRETAQSNEVKNLMRALSGAEDRLRALDLTYRGSILNSQVDRDSISKQISTIDKEVRGLKSEIKATGVSIAESSIEKAVSVTEVQQLLDDDEVLLLYMVSKEKSHGWSISNSEAYRFDVNVENSVLKQKVRDLRASLTPQAFSSHASYPLGLAHWVYKELIAPGLERQPRSSKIIIIPDGPLVEVPYAALRLSETPSIDHDGADNAWLISHYAVSLSPSISSLKALRTTVSKSSARYAFLGIGDPILEGESSPSVGDSDSYSAFYDMRGLGDPSKLSALGSLPDTADELHQIANIFGDSESQIYLGAQATETIVRKLPMQDFRIVAFATHGLLAGSMIGHGEPALVLTPPIEPSLTDDGLLSASEIAMMQFDADLVILSACDTAAGGPDVDAMGLSGLARAFFLAGTRNILASNWPVVSGAAKELTIAMFDKIEGDPQLSYAEALRLAMLEVKDNGESEFSDHPFYWAPFVLIGQ